MALLTGAVVIISLVAIVNMLMLGAVLRRMRQYEQRGATPPRTVEIAVGSAAPEFDVFATDGTSFRTDDLRSGRTLLGFFSDTCEPCVAEAPELVERAGVLATDGITVVPVLAVEPGGGAQRLLPVLGRLGRVLTEPLHGPVASAFQVRATPSYVLVAGDGRIAATGGSLDDCLRASVR
ncbi:TlpA disulfide reductase family protein [Dactylosporangium sp. NPDC000555]|uniref:TlpA family protein disulfide reductase n=1 Tax=Dactylosporangium sp. NPDC000555 TaxID=3154260 RepID=UPI00332EBEC3